MIKLSLAATVAMLLLTAASAAPAQPNTSCTGEPAMSIESLQSLAISLYPQVVSLDQPREPVAIGLVFDSRCRLLSHGLVSRPMFASLRVLTPLTLRAADSTFHTGGVAPLVVRGRAEPAPRHRVASDASNPLLVWGVLKPSDSSTRALPRSE